MAFHRGTSPRFCTYRWNKHGTLGFVMEHSMEASNVLPAEIYGVNRATAIAIVSQVRYAGSEKRIGRTTFWRWCDLLGIPPRRGLFYPKEVRQLSAVAVHYRLGGTEKELLEELNDANCQKQAEVN